MNTELQLPPLPGVETNSDWYLRAMERLIVVVQELSLARSLKDITVIVRHAARELTGADGATFVLRDNGFCHYVDEEAIAPLWKGKRFPLELCISGWSMLNRQSVAIEDIYQDARIPAAAYRPTFVKSLLIVPIRTLDPVGSIGTYWATRRQPTPEEIRILEALANSTSVAMENVQLYTSLERKVAERTAHLQVLNEELDSFSHSVSHDLRAPLRHIVGFVNLLQDLERDKFSPTGLKYFNTITGAAKNMEKLIEDLLEFSRMSRVEMRQSRVDTNALIAEVWHELETDRQGRNITWRADDLPPVRGDRALLKQVWVNLLSNAVKYTGKRAQAKIHVGATVRDGEVEYFVEDNGAGFDMNYADKLFKVFQRLHHKDEFDGTGVGLATVRRIIMRHCGRVSATSEVDHGATFSFALPVSKI